MRAAARICCTLLFSLLVINAPAWAAKVKVCHVPPGNPANFHTITISENALQAHLGHGDLAGACSESCSQLCDDGNACTVDACDASERCLVTHPPVNCDDGNLCTDDTCNPATGCSSTPRTCLDDNLCSVDSCDPLTGQCVFPPAVCDAGQTCNPTNGSCENDAVVCPCAASPAWNAVVTGANPFCSGFPGFLSFASLSGFANASSSGGCGAFPTTQAPIALSTTPEQGAACVALLSTYCPPDD